MSMVHSLILVGALAVALSGAAVAAPAVKTGPIEFEKGKKLWLYLPSEYSAKDKHPLIVYMHGRGGNMRTFEDSPALKPFKDLAMQRGYVMVCPEYGSDGWMNDDAKKYVMASIELAESKLGIDPKRIYLMGISMGGLSTLAFAVEHPDIPAAMCEILGIPDVVQFWYNSAYGPGLEASYGGSPYTKLKEYVKRSATYNINRIKSIPTFIVHGEQDDHVPVAQADTLYHLLKEAGAKVEYIRIPGIGHSEVVLQGNEVRILDFFAATVQPEKTRKPEGEKWQPDW